MGYESLIELDNLLQEILNPTVPKEWRERVEVFVLNKSHNLIVGYNDKGCFFPGGGIEPGDDIIDTAKKECYEELGLKIHSIIPIKIDPFLLDYYELYSKGNIAPSKKIADRMETIRGVKTIFVKASLVSIDKNAKRDKTDNMVPREMEIPHMINYYHSLKAAKPDLKDYVDYRLKILKML